MARPLSASPMVSAAQPAAPSQATVAATLAATTSRLRISRCQRERLKGHGGGMIYMTGLSGAGKSTLATLLECRLHGLGVHTYLLDGDELRQGLGRDLGFSDEDRVENMRRATEVARLMVDAGLIVISAMISPFRAERDLARARFGANEFMEVHVDAPLSVCEQRDPKGLYRRARRGEISGFTGIDSPYEAPQQAEVRIDSSRMAPDAAAEALLAEMSAFGFSLPSPECGVGLRRPARMALD